MYFFWKALTLFLFLDPLCKKLTLELVPVYVRLNWKHQTLPPRQRDCPTGTTNVLLTGVTWEEPGGEEV